MDTSINSELELIPKTGSGNVSSKGNRDDIVIKSGS